MTCIVAVASSGYLAMGSDRLLTCPDSGIMNHTKNKKIRKLDTPYGTVLLGVAGKLANMNRLICDFKAPTAPKKGEQAFERYLLVDLPKAFNKTFTESSDTSVLVASEIGLVGYDDDFAGDIVDYPYWAIGSGAPFALGSLHTNWIGLTGYTCQSVAKDGIRQSILAASEFDPAVGRMPSLEDILYVEL